ncbi:ribosome assembly cofactor RimP [Parabacteroides sp. FAFU027]|uniref:ribosome assembly cofactor RimP n=1 Tax=Parabacteroides sp. FAFU027 TaxID=2922715 RepID=UPI001FB047B0|nr:ribosome assembly cofactor RimP [Parabacteroides sp. FAFU027]
MIDKQLVKAIVEEGLAESESFLVDVMVRPGNAIVVEIDSEEGIDIEECVKLTRLIESRIDREVEDYELEVGSAGVTQPFKVLRQYQMNIGNEVEVLTKDGRKLTGVLKDANEENFTVTTLVKVKIEGEKRKKEVESNLSFKYEEIKHCKYLIRFK